MVLWGVLLLGFLAYTPAAKFCCRRKAMHMEMKMGSGAKFCRER